MTRALMREVNRLDYVLRKVLLPRHEHHPLCESRKGEKCDCYARCAVKAHEALDRLTMIAKNGLAE